MTRVLVKKLNGDAMLPYKKYGSDFCFDVVATSEEEVAPNVWKYGTGLAFQMDVEDEMLERSGVNIAIDLRPRSSVWKTGMALSNSVGTIDKHYTGEVSAVFYHVMPNLPRYKVGDRIGQIKVGIAQAVTFVKVDELPDTDRGGNGYGSTGK